MEDELVNSSALTYNGGVPRSAPSVVFICSWLVSSVISSWCKPISMQISKGQWHHPLDPHIKGGALGIYWYKYCYGYCFSSKKQWLLVYRSDLYLQLVSYHNLSKAVLTDSMVRSHCLQVICTCLNGSKLWKVQPLLWGLSKQCKELYNPCCQLSADLSTIGTKCCLSFI